MGVDDINKVVHLQNTCKLPAPLTTAATNLLVSIQLQYIANSHPLSTPLPPALSNMLIIDLSQQKWLILQQKCPSTFCKIFAKSDYLLPNRFRKQLRTAKTANAQERHNFFYFKNVLRGIHSRSEFNTSTEKGKGVFLCNTLRAKFTDITQHCLLFWLKQ